MYPPLFLPYTIHSVEVLEVKIPRFAHLRSKNGVFLVERLWIWISPSARRTRLLRLKKFFDWCDCILFNCGFSLMLNKWYENVNAVVFICAFSWFVYELWCPYINTNGFWDSFAFFPTPSACIHVPNRDGEVNSCWNFSSTACSPHNSGSK